MEFIQTPVIYQLGEVGDQDCSHTLVMTSLIYTLDLICMAPHFSKLQSYLCKFCQTCKLAKNP